MAKFTIEKEVKITHKGARIASVKERFFLYDEHGFYHGSHHKTTDLWENGIVYVSVSNFVHLDGNYVSAMYTSPACNEKYPRKRFGGLEIEKGRG